MSAHKPNIPQIRKYLNGELNARAMFKLERQAQSDPFLADVIRGMERENIDHQPALNSIDQLLKQRIEKDKKKIIPIYRYWAAAACLLLALGIGGWWLTHQQPKQLLVANTKQPALVPKAKLLETPKILSDKFKPAIIGGQHFTLPVVKKQEGPPIMSELAAAPAQQVLKPAGNDTLSGVVSAADKASPQRKEIATSKETIVIGYGTQKKRELTSSISVVPVADSNLARVGKYPDTIMAHALVSRVAGVALTDDLYSFRTITGKVMDKDDGVGLPGASVRINGQGTQTGADGSFKITVPAKNETLDVGYLGYESQKVKINSEDNLKIELVPNSNSLAEVVVAGYGTRIKPVNQPAHPAIGWDAYEKYLRENAIITDGKPVTVTLLFTVDAHGNVDNIKVSNGTVQLKQQATDLLNNGSKWIGASDGKVKTIKLKVKFHE